MEKLILTPEQVEIAKVYRANLRDRLEEVDEVDQMEGQYLRGQIHLISTLINDSEKK